MRLSVLIVISCLVFDANAVGFNTPGFAGTVLDSGDAFHGYLPEQTDTSKINAQYGMNKQNCQGLTVDSRLNCFEKAKLDYQQALYDARIVLFIHSNQ